MSIYILDILGVFAFSFYGSIKAIKSDFDIFGIFTLGIISSLGGGTIRDLLLSMTPIYFGSSVYERKVVVSEFCSSATQSLNLGHLSGQEGGPCPRSI